MKISIDKNESYSKVPHVIIRCQNENEEVRELVALLEAREKKLIGTKEQEEHVIRPEQLLYAECVDGATFIYTEEEVYRTMYTLAELSQTYESLGYFRCSKSCVINLNAILKLTSELGNRIDACLINGEHIIISRRYAKELRMILKGGEDE